MDKNSLIGFALMGLVLVAFSYYTQPSAEELRERQKQDSIAHVSYIKQQEEKEAAKVAAEEKKAAQLQALLTDSSSLFFNGKNLQEKTITLENNLVKYDLSTKGGLIKQATLKEYTMQDRETPVSLFSDNADFMDIAISGKQANVITSELLMEPVDATANSVTMRLSMGNGHIDFAYNLLPDSYMLNLSIKAEGVSNYFDPATKTMAVTLHEKAKQLEKGYTFENRYATLTYQESDGDTDYLSQAGNKEKTIDEPLDWIAFKNQFFNCTFIADQNWDNAKLSSSIQEKGSGYLKEYDAQATTLFDPSGKQPTNLQFYFGPNHFQTLQAHNDYSVSGKDLELEELVDLGWPLFRWINRFVTLYIFDWLKGWGLNMGIVLLIMTLIMNAFLYPLRLKSFMSSAKMRVLKPKMEEINAKYPNQEDAMRKQQEIMKVYSDYGVSPMGGCLPMLIQMPVFIALFNFVPNAIELRQQSFLWANDLSTYDDLLSWNFNIWGIGDHLSLFCILFCATNIISSVINMAQQDNGSNPQMQSMKWMMYIMPVMFFFIFNDYSSGLCWYYFVSGLVSVLMMWFMKWRTDDEALLAKLEKRRAERKANPKLAKGGSFQDRLQKMMEMQEELQRQQKMNQNK